MDSLILLIVFIVAFGLIAYTKGPDTAMLTLVIALVCSIALEVSKLFIS